MGGPGVWSTLPGPSLLLPRRSGRQSTRCRPRQTGPNPRRTTLPTFPGTPREPPRGLEVLGVDDLVEVLGQRVLGGLPLHISQLVNRASTPGVVPPTPSPGGPTVAFKACLHLGTRDHHCFSGLPQRGSRCSRTYASPLLVTGERRKARLRVAGLQLSRAGFAPAGRRTEFQKLSQFTSSFRTRLAWSQEHRTG